MSIPSSRRVFVGSVPIAYIMLFWLIVSWFGSHPLLGSGARIAGLVMTLTYAIIRGESFADRTVPTSVLDDVGSVLRVNGRVLLAAAGWFVVARLVIFVEQLWDELALPGAFTSPAEGLAFAFTATGVMTVVLYAVALGTAALRGKSPPVGRNEPTADSSLADD